jgi:hypothetical protein
VIKFPKKKVDNTISAWCKEYLEFFASGTIKPDPALPADKYPAGTVAKNLHPDIIALSFQPA